MDYSKIRSELQDIITVLGRWEEGREIPKIELDLALGRISEVYNSMLGLQATPAETATENAQESEQKSAQEPQNQAITLDQLSEMDARFATELFNGDVEEYVRQTKKMLALPTLDEVLVHISENFGWSASSELAQQYVDQFIKRHL